MIWSSALPTGGSEASFSIISSRRSHRLAALDRVGRPRQDGPRVDVALVVRIFLEELRREGVHRDSRATYSRGVTSTWRSDHSSVGISASRRSISASPVETICTTAEWPSARSCSIAPISVGVFIEVMRCEKKRCLVLSKAERAADLALRFSVPESLVMLAASSAAVEIVVDDLEGVRHRHRRCAICSSVSVCSSSSYSTPS